MPRAHRICNDGYACRLRIMVVENNQSHRSVSSWLIDLMVWSPRVLFTWRLGTYSRRTYSSWLVLLFLHASLFCKIHGPVAVNDTVQEAIHSFFFGRVKKMMCGNSITPGNGRHLTKPHLVPNAHHQTCLYCKSPVQRNEPLLSSLFSISLVVPARNNHQPYGTYHERWSRPDYLQRQAGMYSTVPRVGMYRTIARWCNIFITSCMANHWNPLHWWENTSPKIVHWKFSLRSTDGWLGLGTSHWESSLEMKPTGISQSMLLRDREFFALRLLWSLCWRRRREKEKEETRKIEVFFSLFCPLGEWSH